MPTMRLIWKQGMQASEITTYQDSIDPAELTSMVDGISVLG